MTSGIHPNRFDRPLRITAGVLGLIVAVPPLLAFFFVVMFAWLGSDDTPIWLAVPVGAVAIVQLYLAIRTLSARSATTVAVGLLGVVEVAIGVFLLIASPELLPAAIAAIVAIFVAGTVALAAAARIHARGPGVPESAKAPAVQIRVMPATAPSSASQKAGAKKSGRKR